MVQVYEVFFENGDMAFRIWGTEILIFKKDISKKDWDTLKQLANKEA